MRSRILSAIFLCLMLTKLDDCYACPVNDTVVEVLTEEIKVENVVTLNPEVGASYQEHQDYKRLLLERWTDLEYPPQSKRLAECEVVEFSLEVSRDGSVKSVNIIKSSFPRLSLAVEKGSKKWIFRPIKPIGNQSSVIGFFKANFRLFKPNGVEIVCRQP